MKSKRQEIQEKRGAYERKRRKMFSRMDDKALALRRATLLTHKEKTRKTPSLIKYLPVIRKEVKKTNFFSNFLSKITKWRPAY